MEKEDTANGLSGGASNHSNLNIFQKLCRITGECTSLTRTAHNPEGDFYYTPHDKIVELVRELTARYGVVILQTPGPIRREVTTAGARLTSVKYRYDVINSDSPRDRFHSFNFGEALDEADKGFNKCSTASEKNFFVRLFKIPMPGEDPDGAAEQVQPAEQETKSCPRVNCEKCQQPITGIRRSGTFISIEQLMAESTAEFGKKYCANCQLKARRDRNRNEQNGHSSAGHPPVAAQAPGSPPANGNHRGPGEPS
jgi:ERF superfamily